MLLLGSLSVEETRVSLGTSGRQYGRRVEGGAVPRHEDVLHPRPLRRRDEGEVVGAVDASRSLCMDHLASHTLLLPRRGLPQHSRHVVINAVHREFPAELLAVARDAARVLGFSVELAQHLLKLAAHAGAATGNGYVHKVSVLLEQWSREVKMFKRARRAQLLVGTTAPPLLRRTHPDEDVDRATRQLMLEVLEPIRDARQVENVPVATLFLQRSPVRGLGGTGHTVGARLAPPRELMHRIFLGHTVGEPFPEGVARALSKRRPQRVGRRADPHHLVELALPHVLGRAREVKPVGPRRKVSVRQAPVRVVWQRDVGEGTACRVREGQRRCACASQQRARLVTAVYRHVHVGLCRVPLEHLEERPRKDGRPPENTAKRVVLQVRVVELPADYLEPRPSPSREIIICHLRRAIAD
mmetsp:Transcript_15629/g.31409  ORF Transcript_15629/g.31409 Transcript_15629/m.31409 type:complete len:413 (-) Transcript_15629:187-1425(-)